MQIDAADLYAALPDVRATHRLPELGAPVRVFRDPWGIPHVRAGNEHDLFFAQGFVTAQDRLWHMDLDRHRALGRWAEFAGPGAVVQDKLLRAAGMGRTAKLDYEASSSEAKAMIDAYTEGVNAFLRVTEALPVEYKLLDAQPEPWESWHCLATYKIRNTLLGTFEPKVFRTRLVAALGPERVARLIRGYPSGDLLTVPPGAVYEGPELDGLEELSKAAEEANWLGEVDAGSNAWAISGDLTRSGLPLIAGDSHRALDTPSVYYQVHLSCPEFTVIGHSVPGMPGALHFSHNEYVGWGMTHGGADTQDLFIERFRDTDRGREYLFKERWHAAQVLHETILVRGSAPAPIEVTITRHGPVIAGDPRSGTAVAISDPGLIAGTDWPDAVRNAMRARSADELDEAFRRWTDRVNNYAYADVHGSFGYLHRGKIPIRPESNGWRAVPGWTGEYEWRGYIPYEELPDAKNPSEGYVVTCNQRVTDDSYPYYVGLYFAPAYRADRIRSRILETEAGTADVSAMASIHAERTSTPGLVFRAALIALKPWDARSDSALTQLRGWDGSMDRDLVAPTIYAVTRRALSRTVLQHLVGEMSDEMTSGESGPDAHVRQLNMQIVRALEARNTWLLPSGTDWDVALRQALESALDELEARLGPDMASWKWGAVHRTEPRHPLSDVRPNWEAWLEPLRVSAHGDGDTPLAGTYAATGSFAIKGLSVNRYIHDPSDWRNSRWIVPLGASGHPGSPHYADQAASWANVAYIPQLWDWEEIARTAESSQLLIPRDGAE